MKTFGTLFPLVLFRPLCLAQLTYWIDDSCTQHGRSGNFTPALNGAIEMARRGAERLNNSDDKDQHGNYDKLFHVPVGVQPEADIVNGVLGLKDNSNGIARIRPVPNNNREQSNIRFYYDDDIRNNPNSRWKLKPDPNFPPEGYTPMADRPPRPASGVDPHVQYQEWIDDDNEIPTTTLGCQKRYTGAYVQGVTFVPPAGYLTGRDQPDIRSTITICDYQVDSQNGVHSFNDIPETKDIASLMRQHSYPEGINAFGVMTAIIILHELCHTLPHDKIDVSVTDERKAYAWKDVVDLPDFETLQNVNNYVFLGLLAKLADRRFRLDSRYWHWHDYGALEYDDETITGKPPKWPREAAFRPSEACTNATGTIPQGGKVCSELRA